MSNTYQTVSVEDLYKSASHACRQSLEVKPGELVLVIIDEPQRRIGEAFFKAARELGAEAVLTEIIPRKVNAEEPPRAIAEMMKHADVVIIPTSKSMSHTDARRNACAAGARIVTLPGITEDTMVRTLFSEYENIDPESRRIADFMKDADVVHITSPGGTDVTMEITGRTTFADVGRVNHPGDFSNLPAGEAYLAPLEGKTNGIVVVDGSIAHSGVLKEPMRIEVKDGFAEKFSGEYAETFQAYMSEYGKNAFNVAELGIGTNPNATIVGCVLEDEKVRGTVHIAYGNSISMGGLVDVPVHEDGIIRKPTVVVDGRTLMRDGELVFE